MPIPERLNVNIHHARINRLQVYEISYHWLVEQNACVAKRFDINDLGGEIISCYLSLDIEFKQFLSLKPKIIV